MAQTTEKNTLRGAVLAFAVVGALLLSGCAQGGGANDPLAGSSWPGITLADGVIYMAYGSQVYALEPEDEGRRELWTFPVEPNNRQRFFAPPAVGEDVVVVADYTGGVYGLNKNTGEQEWVYRGSRARYIGGATLSQDMAFLGSIDGNMYAVDLETGASLWEFTAGREIWARPLLADGVLYFTSIDRKLYALNAEDGELLWEFPADGEEISAQGEEVIGAMVSTPTLHEGTLYFGSFNNSIYALDIEEREILWTYETSNWTWSSPQYNEAVDLLIGADLDGLVFALDPATGEEVWRVQANGPVVGAPAFASLEDEPVIYFASEDANIYVVDAASGEELRPPAPVNATFQTRFLFFPSGESVRPVPVFAPPIVYNELLLLGSHTAGTPPLYAYDREQLVPEWQFPLTASQ